MQYEEFVGQVQNQARLGTQGAAVKAIQATLETLGERLVEGSAKNLASQLPREIGHSLKEKGTERFGLEEFFERVAERETADLPDAVYHARVVISVLGDAVGPGEIEKVAAQLPDEYTPLFEAGSTGPMRTD